MTSGRHQRSKQGRLVIFPGFFTLFRGIFYTKSILGLVKVLPENNSRTKNNPQKKRKTAHKYLIDVCIYIYVQFAWCFFSTNTL